MACDDRCEAMDHRIQDIKQDHQRVMVDPKLLIVYIAHDSLDCPDSLDFPHSLNCC